MRRFLSTALLAVLAAGCVDSPPPATCRARPSAPHPNVVVVTICSLRFDHTSVAGYERPTTPWLARFARDGVVFDSMVAASSWTKPTTASILTGFSPLVHGLVDYYPREDVLAGRVSGKRALPESFVTLPECLGEAGYDTFGRISNPHAGDAFGLTQGLADVRVEFGMPATTMLADLDAWLGQRDGDRPFFAWLFTRDVHVPYAPAAEAYARFARHPVVDDFAAQRDEIVRDVRARVAAGEDVPVVLQEQWTDLYDAALWTLDAALAGLPALLAGTGHGDDTVVVVTADHGERFFERGRFGHGGRLDEPVLRVPLIVAGAGIAKDRRIPAVVRSVDLYPTLAEIAGVDTTLPLQGLNLAPVLRGAAGTPPPATAYATQGKTHVLRDGQYKLHVRAGGAALHHLPSDPGERTDLRARHPDVVRRMHGALERWIAESRRLAAEREDTTERELTPEVVEQLRALGYVS